MSNLSVQKNQAAQPLETTLKNTGKEAIDKVKTIRNVAAGAAVAGVGLMAAEAAGVVTLPAVIPTAGATIAAGGVAVAFGIIGYIAEGTQNLIENTQKPLPSGN